jgi:hypothetical protein
MRDLAMPNSAHFRYQTNAILAGQHPGLEWVLDYDVRSGPYCENGRE